LAWFLLLAKEIGVAFFPAEEGAAGDMMATMQAFAASSIAYIARPVRATPSARNL
jgi:hypothetical protein